MNRNRRAQAGLSLIELLVSVAIIGLIMTGVFSLFATQNRLTKSQDYMTDMQMDLRAAVSELNFIFSHAGFGCVDSFAAGASMTGTEPVNGTTSTITSFLSSITNGVSSGTTLNPDSVIVTFGQQRVATVTANTAAASPATISVTPEADSAAVTTGGFTCFLCFYPNMDPNTFATVTNTSSGSYTVSSLSADVNSTAAVYMVVPARIRLLKPDNILRVESWMYAQADQNSNRVWELASNIEDFQIQYFDGTVWSGSPANPAGVKAVHFWILARSAEIDPGYRNQNTYTLAGQTVGPFNDGYHRMISESVVWIRNNG